MKFLRIKETCLYVKDLAEAKIFYNEKLGLEVINYLPGKHLFLRAGDSVLLLFNPDDSKNKNSPPAHYAEGKQHFAFEVEAQRFAEVRKEIETLGIPIIDDVKWKSGETSFYFNDPAGNVLEILPEGGIWD